ncbi:MAG: ATP-binding protein [Rhodothermales bacterium]|nr:ATP-binding protein [Rhodothermales bacterium]
MRSLCREYQDLEEAVDGVHDLFAQWEEAPDEAPLDPMPLQVLKLAVHEWVANLAQHADFGGRRPLVRLTFRPNDAGVHCTIEDNSSGFDLARQLQLQRSALGAVAAGAAEPAERGRGLLILAACTQELAYEPVRQDAPVASSLTSNGTADASCLQRLAFQVDAQPAPWLDIPF